MVNLKAARLAGSLLFLSLMSLAAAQRQVGDTEEFVKQRIRLRTLSMSIARDHKLASYDRLFVMEQLDCPFLLNRAFALLVLEGAVDAKALPRSELLTIIERKAGEAMGTSSITYVQAYMSALKLGSADKEKGRQFAVWAKVQKDPQRIDKDERGFVVRLLQDKKVENRMLAGRVLILKSGMDKDSLKWATGQVEAQVSKSKGDVKLYWQFIQRVIKVHSAKP
jgi:hypothetical protein